MPENKEIMVCLSQISEKLLEMDGKISEMNGKVSKLDEKIDGHYEELDKKIENYHNALDFEINKVYLIALENQDCIKKLLIPFNDRNYHANEEIAKIPDLTERLDQMEKVVGDHSEAIRNIKQGIA